MNERIALQPVFGKLDVVKVATDLRNKCAYQRRYEANWVLSNIGLICCFSQKTLYITDSNLNPLLFYSSPATFISACGISDHGKYAICQFAYNRQNDCESGVTILFDIKKRNAISVRKLEANPNCTRQIHIDDDAKMIYIYAGDKKLPVDQPVLMKYDFNLLPDEKSLQRFYDAISRK